MQQKRFFLIDTLNWSNKSADAVLLLLLWLLCYVVLLALNWINWQTDGKFVDQFGKFWWVWIFDVNSITF